MYEIIKHLTAKGFKITEGSASNEELEFLSKLVRKTGAVSVAEAGFNAGFSAYNFLATSPKVNVTSFDIGRHAYTAVAKKFIDKAFPGRHRLVIGDSRETIPSHTPEALFDLVFIDGGHSYSVARADIINLKPLCKAGAVIIMDDVIPWKRWGLRPTLAWREMIRRKFVVQDAIYKDGRKVIRIRPPGDRIWAIGHYTQD